MHVSLVDSFKCGVIRHNTTKIAVVGILEFNFKMMTVERIESHELHECFKVFFFWLLVEVAWSWAFQFVSIFFNLLFNVDVTYLLNWKLKGVFLFSCFVFYFKQNGYSFSRVFLDYLTTVLLLLFSQFSSFFLSSEFIPYPVHLVASQR